MHTYTHARLSNIYVICQHRSVTFSRQEAQLTQSTSRHAKSVEILSTAAQLCEKSHYKRPALVAWPCRLFKVIGAATTR